MGKYFVGMPSGSLGSRVYFPPRNETFTLHVVFPEAVTKKPSEAGGDWPATDPNNSPPTVVVAVASFTAATHRGPSQRRPSISYGWGECLCAGVGDASFPSDPSLRINLHLPSSEAVGATQHVLFPV